MIGTSHAAVMDGIHARAVLVEADVSSGLPNFSIVGLPDSAVSESKLRIRSAIRNAGFQFPTKRITVNLSPASVKKRGAGLDLAIAIAILRASEQLPLPMTYRHAFCAELSLSGKLIAVHGIANMAFALSREHIHGIVVAEDALKDCVPMPSVRWFMCATLQDLVSRLQHSDDLSSVQNDVPATLDRTDGLDYLDVVGMEDVKRTLCIAAVGGHHLALIGPPGCGKTMMAERFATILPSLTSEQAIEAFAYHQSAGLSYPLSLTPPLRAPHHSLTVAGLVGGGIPPSPGEVTLSHHGVLMLDELLEFSRDTLEALREPLTTEKIRLSRAGRMYDMPARFQLIATMNPCPCGQKGFGDCRCLDSAIKRYWLKASGPLLDRIDMMLSISLRDFSQVPQAASCHDSKTLRERIGQARQFLMRHSVRDSRIQGVAHRLDISDSSRMLLSRAARSLQFSQRRMHATVRVAESICALHEQESIHAEHIEEAIAMRSQVIQ